jgi:transposase InsO family protein
VAAEGRTEVKAPSGSWVHTSAANTQHTAAVSASSPASSSPVDLAALAAAQQSCPDCQQAASSTVLRVTTIKMDNTSIMVDTSSGVFRPLVPAVFRRPVFEAVHNLAHPGIRATRRLIASRFVWPRLASQVAEWCRDCVPCQRAKVSAQPSSPPQAITNPLQRFSHIHIDLVGPLPQSSTGLTHLLTVVDRSTRWAEAIPLRSTTADSCAAALVDGWISRFGIPQQITSNRGAQFTSSVWSSLLALLGIKSKLTTPYHPQANGAVERFHRRLKDSLRARLAGSDWPSHLPWVLFGLRAAPRTLESPPPSWFTAAHYPCLVNSSPAPSNRRPPSFATSTRLLPAWRTIHTAPRRRLVHDNYRRRLSCTSRPPQCRQPWHRPTEALTASWYPARSTSF